MILIESTLVLVLREERTASSPMKLVIISCKPSIHRNMELDTDVMWRICILNVGVYVWIYGSMEWIRVRLKNHSEIIHHFYRNFAKSPEKMDTHHCGEFRLHL